MSLSQRTRKRILSRDPSSAATKQRDLRTQAMLRYFPDFTSYRVLDLGGTARYWNHRPFRPAHVTIVNLEQRRSLGPAMTHIEADACEFEPPVGEQYDMVFSNSVIEHVGGFSRRQQLAEVARAISPNIWIQTPYRYFPIEPHWLMPGQQFLPLALRAHLSQHWTLGLPAADDYEQSVEKCLGTELLSQTEIQYLFPDAAIWKERWHGITKSIVAVRRRRMR